MQVFKEISCLSTLKVGTSSFLCCVFGAMYLFFYNLIAKLVRLPLLLRMKQQHYQLRNRPNVVPETKRTSYHLRRIRSVHKYITAYIFHKLVVALVTSNIDYCNGLLGDLAAKDVDRLQWLQNRAARLVSRLKAAIYITPIHKDLHWLSIQERIHYKIIMTVYKCIYRLATNYLSSILTTRTWVNRLRQKQVCHELNTHFCAKVVGKQAFRTRAP